MNEAQTPEASGITGLILIGVILIPWVTLAISELLLWLYRRAVVRAMGGKRSHPVVSHGTAAAQAATPPGVDLVVQTADAVAGAPSSGRALYDRFELAARETSGVYITAGLVYAGLMAVAMGVQSRTLSFPAWLAYTAAFAWPAVLTALLIIPLRTGTRVKIVVASFAVFLLGALVPPTRSYLFAIFAANAAATIVGMIVRTRRVHAVAPLVGAVLTVVSAGLLFAFAVAYYWGGQKGDPGTATEFGTGEAFLFLGVLLTLTVMSPFAAWFTLRAVAARYGRKRTSEQAISMAALWVIFAGIQSTTFAFVDERWIGAGAAAFLAFALVTAIGFARLRRRAASGERGPRLLVLRVFALGPRSRDLFDRFTTRWRHIGSVQLIAGPDLASSTVEPHEFLDFLRRRLGHRYLDGAESIDQALTQLDTTPDPDGRYRITDFICRDHAWRTVFRRLAAASDVVLMDLRGFSPVNAGCTYEVGELLNVVPSDRITIVVDQSTDEAFLARTLDEARARLTEGSPNLSAASIRLLAFRETGGHSLDPDRLFRLLCDRVTPSAPEQRQVVQAV